METGRHKRLVCRKRRHQPPSNGDPVPAPAPFVERCLEILNNREDRRGLESATRSRMAPRWLEADAKTKIGGPVLGAKIERLRCENIAHRFQKKNPCVALLSPRAECHLRVRARRVAEEDFITAKVLKLRGSLAAKEVEPIETGAVPLPSTVEAIGQLAGSLRRAAQEAEMKAEAGRRPGPRRGRRGAPISSGSPTQAWEAAHSEPFAPVSPVEWRARSPGHFVDFSSPQFMGRFNAL